MLATGLLICSERYRSRQTVWIGGSLDAPVIIVIIFKSEKQIYIQFVLGIDRDAHR